MVGQSLQSGFAICHPQPDALPAITMRYFRFPILDESSQNRVYGCHLIFVVGQQRWCSQLTFIAHLACAHWAHGLDQYSTARFRDPPGDEGLCPDRRRPREGRPCYRRRKALLNPPSSALLFRSA